MTIAQKIIQFNRQLEFKGSLPEGFRVLNPFLSNPETLEVMTQFYDKFYGDKQARNFLIGINPSRHGAGVTGVPFTDTKRLASVCGIEMETAHTHEISSVYLYDVIEAFGGAKLFYKSFYINSPFPLAIIRQTGPDQWVNANYYDDVRLFEALKPFMIESLKNHVALGLKTDHVFVLGKKNYSFLDKINKQEKLFEEMHALDHPRFIQQYKSKIKEQYINQYLKTFEKYRS